MRGVKSKSVWNLGASCSQPLSCVSFASGITLRRIARDATVEVLEGISQLIEVILKTPLQRYPSHLGAQLQVLLPLLLKLQLQLQLQCCFVQLRLQLQFGLCSLTLLFTMVF